MSKKESRRIKTILTLILVVSSLVSLSVFVLFGEETITFTEEKHQKIPSWSGVTYKTDDREITVFPWGVWDSESIERGLAMFEVLYPDMKPFEVVKMGDTYLQTPFSDPSGSVRYTGTDLVVSDNMLYGIIRTHSFTVTNTKTVVNSFSVVVAFCFLACSVFCLVFLIEFASLPRRNTEDK